MLKSQEYWPLSNDTKIAKVAPPGWKDPHKHPTGNAARVLPEVVTLYLRLKHFPDDVDKAFKDAGNKHQFYLQLRRDLLHARYSLSRSQYLSLAGMSLQIEFGDYSEDIHGSDDDYFMLEHYLPSHMIPTSANKSERDEIKKSLVKLHRAHLGQSQSKTEIKFCKELQRLDDYGFHFFKVSKYFIDFFEHC